MAEGGGSSSGGMKGSTILLVLVILWFLSTQVAKLTTSVNKAAGAANNVSKPLGQIGNATAGLINAGAAAIGIFAQRSGGSSSVGVSTSDDLSSPANTVYSTTEGIDPTTGGAQLSAGDTYGPPAPPSAWSSDSTTSDYSNLA